MIAGDYASESQRKTAGTYSTPQVLISEEQLEQLRTERRHLLAACEAQYSKFGNVPSSLNELATQLKNGRLGDRNAWAIVRNRIAETQRAAIAAARGPGE